MKIYEVPPRFLAGRPYSFATPEEFYNKCIEYFKYVDDNPWVDRCASNGMSTNGVSQSNSTQQTAKPLQRPYTKQGFMAFCALGSHYRDFRRINIDREGFRPVIEWFEAVIQDQQVSGAMIGKFNSNLVSRLNEIADHVVNEVTGKDGQPFRLPTLTAKDIEDLKAMNGLK